MRLRFLFALVSLIVCQQINANTYIAVADGDFEAAATWSPAGSPGDGDEVIIPHGITVTVTTNYAPDLFRLSLGGTLLFTNGAKLNFANNGIIQITNTGLLTGGNGGSHIIFAGGNTYTGDFNQSGPYYYTSTNSGSGIVGVLPLKMNQFSAIEKQGGIQIEWTSHTEELVDHYEIEISKDGSSFTTIAYILVIPDQPQQAGQRYSYFDPNVSGLTIYRIKVVHISGKLIYGPAMRVNPSSKQSSLHIYPNPVPVAGTTAVQAAALQKGNYQLSLFNASGVIVHTFNFRHPGGAATKTINLPASLPAGQYIVQLKDDNTTLTRQLSIK